MSDQSLIAPVISLEVGSKHSMAKSPTNAVLYVELAEKLSREITGRRYAVGSLLPTELELAKSYGVSRQTVRAALDVLQERGYISRKKSVGTRVETLEATSQYVQTVASIEDLVKVAASEVRDITSVQAMTLDRASARRLQAPIGSEWLVFEGLRVDVRAQRQPIARVKFYIDSAFSDIRDSVLNHPEMLISSIIERECEQLITDLTQIVTAVVIDDATADALKLGPGQAGLRIVRHYKNMRNEILEISETIYPADRMSLLTQMRLTKRTG
ncbi:GntR family transcriptional regulator [Nitrobacteraceae bacterium AZCC 2161]